MTVQAAPIAVHLQPTPEQAIALFRADPSLHFVGCSHIKMKDGGVRQPKKCNLLQQRLFQAYLWLQSKGLPINIIILKPRQSGGSEGTAQLVYHHSRRFNLGGFMMADIEDHTTNIWNLFCNKGRPGMDLFDAYWGNEFKFNTEHAWIKRKGANGRMEEACWDRGTANSITAGASGTRQIIWLSESARYAKSGAFQDTTVIGNALNSIPPDLPNTMRIAESTAEGSGGWFANTFDEGVYLEERIKGKMGNGWVRIFVGWHECDDYTLPETEFNREFFDDEDGRWAAYADEERAGIIRYNWNREQIAWRRKKIISDLGGDVRLFKRDFPASPEEAWASSGTKRFNVVAVANLLQTAQHWWARTLKRDPMAPKLGSLNDGAGGVVWLWTIEDVWLWVAEQPKYGLRYSLIIDPMTGEQSAGSDKRDSHAVMVMRHGYFDDNGAFHPSAVVSCIHIETGCQWDMDVLADRVALLNRWYGNCVVVLEVNIGESLIILLKKRGVTNFWVRPQRADVNNPSERQTTIGFKTTTSTRRMWVDSAAEVIREGSFECLYLPAVREFDTFVVNKDGKFEAAAGSHDDWVAAFGIGTLTIGAATLMRLPVIQAPVRQISYSAGYGSSFGNAAIG